MYLTVKYVRFENLYQLMIFMSSVFSKIWIHEETFRQQQTMVVEAKGFFCENCKKVYSLTSLKNQLGVIKSNVRAHILKKPVQNCLQILRDSVCVNFISLQFHKSPIQNNSNVVCNFKLISCLSPTVFSFFLLLISYYCSWALLHK